MEVNKFVLARNKDIDAKWEEIFSILDNEHEPEILLLMILINTALQEVVGRRVERDDFFHVEHLLSALNLIEHWLKKDSYFKGKVH